MSWELLKEVESAEARAEEARQGAQKEAREILKAVEESCAVHEREAALEHRALSQRILEDAKATARRGIDLAQAQEAKRRDAVAEAARGRLEAASDIILKRIVADGHR